MRAFLVLGVAVGMVVGGVGAAHASPRRLVSLQGLQYEGAYYLMKGETGVRVRTDPGVRIRRSKGARLKARTLPNGEWEYNIKPGRHTVRNQWNVRTGDVHLLKAGERWPSDARAYR